MKKNQKNCKQKQKNEKQGTMKGTEISKIKRSGVWAPTDSYIG